ncbi:cyclopropane-fatty-acyl-phospholipid synthase [Luminiphilus sp.]|jgi:cyclopropane-fatty-acyl-phospholipid synthase|nr:cyclopropane-fatty-acyl-phospholipid synthase family protein [Luminiphilus sp.]MDC6472155.1 cyclopropane-fatty-acyl-phospholipid synthase [Luminiphilus sp.]
MSEYSVKKIGKLPLLFPEKHGGLARSFMWKVLGKLQVGSLTLREGDEAKVFGSTSDGSAPHAEVNVHDTDLYRRILTGGSIAAGETFIEGMWSSPDLTEVTRAFSANMAMLEAMSDKQNWLARLALKLSHWARRNTSTRSRENISAHYDLGNDFFSLFLDPSMMYSSAVFPSASADLASASQHKLKLICEDLELKAEDHLVEIGTGWGGMAIFAAEHYGCRVTTTTISRQQYDYTLEAVAQKGLEDQVTVLFDDYRDLQGQYDKLVSIEMIEAVGHQFYDTYFQKISHLLKPHGKAVIQAITITEQRYEQARDSVDFIKRYIFPGGCLPSLTVVSDALSRVTDMQMSNLRDIGRDYADTLKVWHASFLNKLDEVRAMGFDDRFIRMWRYYLSYCEGGFRERIIGTHQITLTKPGYRPD